jgi:hypothetical protein
MLTALSIKYLRYPLLKICTLKKYFFQIQSAKPFLFPDVFAFYFCLFFDFSCHLENIKFMKSILQRLYRSIQAVIVVLFIMCFFVYNAKSQSSKEARPRIVITADPELDDNNSLIRFLLYSSDLHVEGLIYASSGFHWKGDGKGTKWFVPEREYARFGLDTCPCESWRWAKDERFIHNAVEAYANMYPNLKVHNPGYPAPEELKSNQVRKY